MTTSRTFLLSGFLMALAVVGLSCDRQNMGGAETKSDSKSGAEIAHPTMTFEKPPLTSLDQILSSTNAEGFWTRSINVSGAKVQQILRDRQFLTVGPDQGRTVVVRLRDSHPEIKVGQNLDLAGIVEPLGRDISQWNVPPEDRAILAQHSVYISETSIRASVSR